MAWTSLVCLDDGRQTPLSTRLDNNSSRAGRDLYRSSTLCAQAAAALYRGKEMNEEIERRAYALWEQDGRPHGQDQAYWFKAADEVAAAAAATIKPVRKRAARTRKAA
ncbi:DUF2934 domain-containing protein [Devosia chinhatensis]|uniref:DUF2934 domain-containing protein n=1 Tax=Devosia chinhatensis TaxID=429727 RepID=UPI001FCE0738|nr:DUF2934 domain-containing protein [Devosia chinhatensis]